MKNPFDFEEVELDKLYSKALKKVGDKISAGTYTSLDDRMIYLLAQRYQQDTRDCVNYLRFVDPSIVSKSLDRLAVERAISDVELPDWEREALNQIKRLQGRFSSKQQKPLESIYQEMQTLDKNLELKAKNPEEASDLVIGLGLYTKARAVRALAKYAWDIQQNIIKNSK